MNTMSFTEIRDLLKGADDRWLFQRAADVREECFGTDVYLRGVIEFSNCCARNCLYCGLRQANRNVERYRMGLGEILETANTAAELGVRTLVLQSGDDYQYGSEEIGHLIGSIKDRFDVALTLCLGDRRKEEFCYWHDRGADRYLLKIETFDKTLHESLRPGQNVARRLATLDFLKSLGFEVGSGIIIGLPGMTADILAGDILALSKLDLDMIAAGPFVPHPHTPLRQQPAGDLLTSFRTIAILRIMNPEANIPATSAFESLPGNGKVAALRCGANVLMPSMTPEALRQSYSIYPGKNTHFSQAEDEISAARSLIRVCELTYSASPGFSPRHQQ